MSWARQTIVIPSPDRAQSRHGDQCSWKWHNFLLMVLPFYCFDVIEASRNCTASSFRCPNNGNCIPQVWVCDGDPDCDGGADERDCSVLLTRTCPPSQHRCGNGACLPAEWRCDGDPDCSDMSDETGCQQSGDGGADGAVDRDCGADEFQCASGHCIKGAYRCDGEIHCRYIYCSLLIPLILSAAHFCSSNDTSDSMMKGRE